MLDWRIYYADGTTCDSERVSCWEDAPATGVLCVIVRNDRTGRFVLSGVDYFYRPPSTVWLARQAALDEEPFVAKTDNLTPALQTYAPWIKWGQWTGEATFLRILALSNADTDFPIKSALDQNVDAEKVP